MPNDPLHGPPLLLVQFESLRFLARDQLRLIGTGPAPGLTGTVPVQWLVFPTHEVGDCVRVPPGLAVTVALIPVPWRLGLHCPKSTSALMVTLQVPAGSEKYGSAQPAEAAGVSVTLRAWGACGVPAGVVA